MFCVLARSVPNFAKLRNASLRLCLDRDRLNLFCGLDCGSSILAGSWTFRYEYLDAWHCHQLVGADCMLLVFLGDCQNLFLYLLLYLLFNLLNLLFFESVVLSVTFDLVLNNANILVGPVNILDHALLLNCYGLLKSLEEMLVILLSLRFNYSLLLHLGGLVLQDRVRLY